MANPAARPEDRGPTVPEPRMPPSEQGQGFPPAPHHFQQPPTTLLPGELRVLQTSALAVWPLTGTSSTPQNAQALLLLTRHSSFAEHMHVYTEQCKRALSTTVNNKLLPRRDQLFTQMARLKARMDEVRAVKANVELDTKQEFTSVRAQPPEATVGDEMQSRRAPPRTSRPNRPLPLAPCVNNARVR